MQRWRQSYLSKPLLKRTPFPRACNLCMCAYTHHTARHRTRSQFTCLPLHVSMKKCVQEMCSTLTCTCVVQRESRIRRMWRPLRHFVLHFPESDATALPWLWAVALQQPCLEQGSLASSGHWQTRAPVPELLRVCQGGTYKQAMCSGRSAVQLRLCTTALCSGDAEGVQPRGT